MPVPGCSGSGPTAAAISKNSSFKEEVTATLLQTLHQHPRASLPVPQGIPNSDQSSQQSQDISVITEGAAYSQTIAELTDWLGSAKIALQVRLRQNMHITLHGRLAAALPVLLQMPAGNIAQFFSCGGGFCGHAVLTYHILIDCISVLEDKHCMRSLEMMWTVWIFFFTGGPACQQTDLLRKSVC